MEYRKPGTRRAELDIYNNAKHRPYDYRSEGLLNKIMPARVTSATNPTTRLVLAFVEAVGVFLLDYTDTLKNFKDWNYRPH